LESLPSQPDRPVVLGRIASPHGVKGWVKVQGFGHTPETLLQQSAWWIGSRKDWKVFTVVASRAHGNTVLAKLEGLETREAAMALQGSEVGVPRDRFPAAEEGEYYWIDLQGMQVVNREGVHLGMVDSLFSNGAHSVLVVRSGVGKGEWLIPFVAAFVDDVDEGTRRIWVDWRPEWQ
jgi:16S rRNA processing protein RimM